MSFSEKTLSSDVIYAGRIIRVRNDKVELDNGATAFREVVDHTGGVGILAITPDGKVPMVRQFRYPFMAETLEVPAGKLEAGEDPLECAVRELSEETGLEAEKYVSLGSILPSPGDCAETLYVYLAQNITAGRQHLDEDEFLNVEYYTLPELHRMVMDNTLTDAKTVIAILKAENYLRESK